MLHIRYVQQEDRDFWYSLDRHLPESEFDRKVSDQRGYVLLEDDVPVGLLRYNLFWDNTPFCTCYSSTGTIREKAMAKC